MSAAGQWSDLTTRLGSAVALVAVGFIEIWLGGDAFHIFVAVVCGIMVWELVRMMHPATAPIAFQLGALSGAALLMASYLPPTMALPLLIAPSLVGVSQIPRDRLIYAVYSAIILLGGLGMVSVRDHLGFDWMLWLVAVVVATDIAGYFAGRLIGGPKFWPAVSPKKTWSGTGAGWVGAAIVGVVFAAMTSTGFALVLISILISMASQAGDIAESAIKRRVGAKDSSNLIPGHGGVLDRFDGMLGASIMLFGVALIFGFPSGLM